MSILLGGTVHELLAPDDALGGPLSSDPAARRSGVYALAWETADPEATAAHMRSKGLSVEAAGADAAVDFEVVVAGARHWLTGSR